MSVLTVTNLCKKYPAFTLDSVSFQLEDAKITGFVGRNGAGKTTTLKSLFNLVHPDSGDIAFFGQNFAGNEATIKQRVGFALGGFSFYQKKKLAAITAATRRFYTGWDETAYAALMAKFNLDENKTPAELSAGMRVKYSLALALSHNAKLLILDEPTSGLDPFSREELLEIFLDLRDRGISILFSTHITADLDKCADNILYIQNGRLAADSSTKVFVSGYKVVSFTSKEEAAPFADKLIGHSRSKNGFSALVKYADAPLLTRPVLDASLESIMVHMEKEASHEESAL